MTDAIQFQELDDLVVDQIASFLDIKSAYHLACADRSPHAITSPEWFIRHSLDLESAVTVIPLDEMAREYFYLAPVMSQMNKCRFYGKYFKTKRDFYVGHQQSIARLLHVDFDSVYADRMNKFMVRLLETAVIHMEHRGQTTVKLLDVIIAATSMGFKNLPDHDTIFDFESWGELASDSEGIVMSTVFDVLNTRGSLTAPDLYESGERISTTHDVVDAATLKQALADEMFAVPKHDDEEEMEDHIVTRLQQVFHDKMLTISLQDEDVDMDDWLDNFDPSPDFDRATFAEAAEKIRNDLKSEFKMMVTFMNHLETALLDDLGVKRPKLRLDPSLFFTTCEKLAGTPSHGFSRSALALFQLIVEEFHFGYVVEAKLEIDGYIEAQWDYGLLFGPNGTFLHTLQMSNAPSESTSGGSYRDDEDDEDYWPTDDESEEQSPLVVGSDESRPHRYTFR